MTICSCKHLALFWPLSWTAKFPRHSSTTLRCSLLVSIASQCYCSDFWMTNLIKSKNPHQRSQQPIKVYKGPKKLVNNLHLKLRFLLAAMTHSRVRKKDNHLKDPNFHLVVQLMSPRCSSWSKTSKSSSCRGASSQNHSTINGLCKAWFVPSSQSL